MTLSQRLAVRFLNLANIFCIIDGRSPPQFLFDADHFHIEATLDTTDFDNISKKFLIFTKKDIHSLKLMVTLLQVFPNLYPCVYIVSRMSSYFPIGGHLVTRT